MLGREQGLVRVIVRVGEVLRRTARDIHMAERRARTFERDGFRDAAAQERMIALGAQTVLDAVRAAMDVKR